MAHPERDLRGAKLLAQGLLFNGVAMEMQMQQDLDNRVAMEMRNEQDLNYENAVDMQRQQDLDNRVAVEIRTEQGLDNVVAVEIRHEEDLGNGVATEMQRREEDGRVCGDEYAQTTQYSRQESAGFTVFVEGGESVPATDVPQETTDPTTSTVPQHGCSTKAVKAAYILPHTQEIINEIMPPTEQLNKQVIHLVEENVAIESTEERPQRKSQEVLSKQSPDAMSDKPEELQSATSMSTEDNPTTLPPEVSSGGHQGTRLSVVPGHKAGAPVKAPKRLGARRSSGPSQLRPGTISSIRSELTGKTPAVQGMTAPPQVLQIPSGAIKIIQVAAPKQVAALKPSQKLVRIAPKPPQVRKSSL